jgi:hypothetical protein
MNNQEQTQQDIELTITLTRSGDINVSGPIGDKILAYGMLEVAKDIINDHHKGKRRITPATITPIKLKQ